MNTKKQIATKPTATKPKVAAKRVAIKATTERVVMSAAVKPKHFSVAAIRNAVRHAIAVK